MNFALALQHDPAAATALFSRISEQLGPGWAEALLPPGWPAGKLSGRAHLFLSRHLSARMARDAGAAAAAGGGLPDDLASQRLLWAVVLLPAERLQRFVRYLGAVLVGGEVVRAIGRIQIESYRQALGAELYSFVLHRAPLMGIAAPNRPPVGPDAISDAISSAGVQALLKVTDPTTELGWRLRLKLPWTALETVALPDFLPGTETLRRALLRVLREVETVWTQQMALLAPTSSCPTGS